MNRHLRWAIRIAAVLNITQLAAELVAPQHTPLDYLLSINLVPLWLFSFWAFLTSLLLPACSFIGIAKMNDSTRAKELKPVIIDVSLALGWFFFFWATILWKFSHTVTWL